MANNQTPGTEESDCPDGVCPVADAPDPTITFLEATTDNAQVIKMIDSNMFSGSRDAFRTAVGGYWYLESGSAGDTLQFQSFKTGQPLLPYFDKIGTNTELIETISDDAAILNKRIPVRVFGNTTVENDKFWETLFMGGSYADEPYYPLYNEKLYGYNYFISSLPYHKKDVVTITNGSSISDQIQITFKYNKYLPEYQNHIETLGTERLIPNFYLLSDAQSYDIVDDDACGVYQKSITNFITLEGDYPNVDTVLSTNSLDGYLTSSYVNANLSASTRVSMRDKMQNIFLDDEFLNKIYNTDKADSYASMFPYYVQINFPLTKTQVEIDGVQQNYSPFLDSIVDNKYTNKFLKTLKEVFTGEIAYTPLTLSKVNLNKNYISSSEGDSVDYDVESNEEIRAKRYDYFEFLSYTYNNFDSTTENNFFMGKRNVYRSGMSDKIGAYRYANSIGAGKTFADAMKYMSTPSHFDITGLSDFLYQNEKGCHNETLAYRIEKVGGAPTGDARNRNAIQNYWLINSKELEEFNFYDTQVRYNQDYTYNVYAYILVTGVRYKFSDLRVSKGISANNEWEAGTKLFYGLEFYDPKTGEKSEQLFASSDSDGGEFTDLNSLGSLVQAKSEFPYLADFYLNYEPCVMIYEIPILSKPVRVLDNPPNKLNVYPYQHLDASKKIGFRFNYDAPYERVFPTVITSADSKLKDDYMNAKDLLSSDTLSEYTVSRPRSIEVFRTDKRPTAYTDFDGKKIESIDLKMKNSKHTHTVEFFDQRIRTNKKYYYLFRALNEQRVIGPISEIYEVQLVNDGGYSYALFNIIYEEQLKQAVFTNPSKKFKKLIHLQPNLSQLTLDTTDVDFEQDAITQISNIKVGSTEDLVWGKTFKVRLTSKKTGKKIDLNITYNLRSQIE